MTSPSPAGPMTGSSGWTVVSGQEANASAVDAPCYLNESMVFSAQGGPTHLGPLPETFGGDVTISAWVMSAVGEATASWARIVDLGTAYGGAGDNILLTHIGNTGHFGYQVYVGDKQLPMPQIVSKDPIPTGVWLWVVAVQANDTASLCVSARTSLGRVH